MEISIKTYNELTLDELHDILQLRAEVFVVEQDCVYQDIDGKDRKALHIIGSINNQIIAYTRCFEPGMYFVEAAIGRVVVSKPNRKDGYGHRIMEASIKAIQDRYKTTLIALSAQTYLESFYQTHSFTSVGESYLEDGIPHIKMIKKH